MPRAQVHTHTHTALYTPSRTPSSLGRLGAHQINKHSRLHTQYALCRSCKKKKFCKKWKEETEKIRRPDRRFADHSTWSLRKREKIQLNLFLPANFTIKKQSKIVKEENLPIVTSPYCHHFRPTTRKLMAESNLDPHKMNRTTWKRPSEKSCLKQKNQESKIIVRFLTWPCVLQHGRYEIHGKSKSYYYTFLFKKSRNDASIVTKQSARRL